MLMFVDTPDGTVVEEVNYDPEEDLEDPVEYAHHEMEFNRIDGEQPVDKVMLHQFHTWCFKDYSLDMTSLDFTKYQE